MRVTDGRRIQSAQVGDRGIGVGVRLEVSYVSWGRTAKFMADFGCSMFYLAVYKLGKKGFMHFKGEMGRGFKEQRLGKFSGSSVAAENTAAGV